MSNQALYRTLRPKTFDGVVGQEHITDVLKKQVEKKTPSHAYLFYGPRGSGKTSSSRILANALNCLNPKDGNPCGECDVCKACKNESFVDIIEMDAASNSGVEDVREMLERVPLLPAEGKYKVYIIDEVHMFSKSAFNALLKTLEEPPPHAVFIFATTELNKVPKTIFSRTQKFGFKRLSNELIESYISGLLDDMKIGYDKKALKRISVFADGAMRDALSLLDQCLSDGDVTTESVTKILGIPSEEATQKLCDAIMKEKISEAVGITNRLLADGISSSEILTGCSARFTELLIEKAGDKNIRNKILNAIWVLNDALSLIKYTNVQSAVTLSAIVQAAESYASPSDKNLALEVKRLNEELAGIKERGALPSTAPASETDNTLKARVEKLEGRITKAAEMYIKLNSEYQALKKQTEQLNADLSGAFAADGRSKGEEQLIPSVYEDYNPENLKLNAIDAKEASSILYPSSEDQLRGMRELAIAKDPTLITGLNVIQKLEISGGKVLLYANKDDIGMTNILQHDGLKSAFDGILEEIYGEIPEIEFVPIEESRMNVEEVEEGLKESGFSTEVIDETQQRLI